MRYRGHVAHMKKIKKINKIIVNKCEDHLANRNADGRIILKLIFNPSEWEHLNSQSILCCGRIFCLGI
jgi:hypothetical protein